MKRCAEVKEKGGRFSGSTELVVLVDPELSVR